MYEERKDVIESGPVSEKAFTGSEHNEGRNPEVLWRNGKQVRRVCTKFCGGHQVMEVVGDEAVIERWSVGNDAESCKKKRHEPTVR